MIERPTATTSASSTPKTTTHVTVTPAIATSTRSIAASVRQAAGSAMLIAAETSTAPSTALGRYCTGSVRKSRTTTTVLAANSPAICVRAPIASFTAVRAPLAPIENPCVKPAAAFAAPITNSSCEARTCSPRLPANARAVRISSANETRKTPSAAGTSWSTSPSGGVGMLGRGSPPATGPTVAIPCSAKSSAHEAPIAPTTTSSAPGSAGMKRRRTRSAVSVTALSAIVVPLTSPSSRATSPSFCSGSVASTGTPSSFPSCEITSTIATPCR